MRSRKEVLDDLYYLDYEEAIDMTTPQGRRYYKNQRKELSEELEILDDKVDWEEIGW